MEPQAGAEPVEFTFGADAPDYAQGKTAQELLDLTKNLHTTVQNMSYAAPAPQPVTPTPVQTTVQTTVNSQPDPNLMYTDPVAYQSQLANWVQTTQNKAMELQAQPILQSQASMAKDQSRRNPKFTEVWSRYGPEIEAALATVPPQMKIQPSVWDQAAAMVQGQHFEELAKHQYAPTNTDTGMLSGDGVTGTGEVSSSMSPLSKAWSEDSDWIARFKRLPGMTLSKLKDQVSSMGWSEEDYVKTYENKTAMRIHNSDAELARHGVV